MNTPACNASIDRVVEFLASIGLPPREQAIETTSFLPGIRIERGILLFDRMRLLAAGDLLHEAGHIALTPAQHRHAIDGDVLPEQHYVHGGEVEAIAWSFAAATAIGLALTELFHADGYRGQSQGLALSFSLGVYPGVAGLTALGLTAIGEQARLQGVPAYPHMQRWLRD
jgi:hypothetical protein